MEAIIGIIMSIMGLRIVMKIIATIILISVILFLVSHMSGMGIGEMFNQIANFFNGLVEQLKTSLQN